MKLHIFIYYLAGLFASFFLSETQRLYLISCGLSTLTQDKKPEPDPGNLRL